MKDLDANKKPIAAYNNESVLPLEDELLSEADCTTIALKQRLDKFKGVHQIELDVHYTATKHTTAKLNKICTWMKILSA
jgi:hypothetical protein